jgi:hypothetical protein
MAILKGRGNAGQGGKIGHSNQDHWEFTEEIKVAARKRRRHQAKAEISAAVAEFGLTDEAEQGEPEFSDEFPQ